MIIVYGTTASGKSERAEEIALKYAKQYGLRLVYLATMENKSEAAQKRIKWHEEKRRGKGFYLAEEMYEPSKIEEKLPFKLENSVVLLECLSNLVANVMFDNNGHGWVTGDILMEETQMELAGKVADSIFTLGSKCRELVVVTNNVFTEGKYEDFYCDAYMKCLGMVNIILTQKADEFYEITCGETWRLK